MSPTATPVPLNLKSWKSAAPVCAHETHSGAIRQIYHEIHVRPNLGDVHSAKRRRTTPALQWSDVKSKVIADADVAPPAKAAATVKIMSIGASFPTPWSEPEDGERLPSERSGQALFLERSATDRCG